MNVEHVLNVLINGITEGTIDAKTTIYIDPDGVRACGSYMADEVKIVKIGNGYKVVIE
jgi:hypothetical protein